MNVVETLSTVISRLPTYTQPIIKTIIVLVFAFLIIKIGSIIIERIFSLKYENVYFSESKQKTLTSLLKSVLKYLTYFVAIVNLLEICGIKTASLLTAAGIGGLAVGFGAQSLVKDIISGFFIIFEDQYNVGDYIEVSQVSGIVEEIGLRITKLRDFSGELHIIPNGEVSIVSNHSKGSMRAMVDINIAYEEDIDNAIKILEQVCNEVRNKRSEIIEGPDVLGVTRFGTSEVVITIVAKTIPMQQWSIERELRMAIKNRFDQEGIEIPYPRTVVIKKSE